MQIHFWYIGKNKHSYIKDGMTDFEKRLKHYCNFHSKEFKAPKNLKNANAEEVKLKEGQVYLNQLKENDFLILLDEKGKTFNSVSFANHLQKKMNQSPSRVIFIIGGAFGFSAALYQRANDKISLSEMTFSHQLIRVIFLEQLYRAFTILKGEKYHNV